MNSSLFDRLQSPATMIEAEIELLALGADAIPVLESLFSGAARNQFGVPYRQLGLPLRCAIEVASRLGVAARPLEPYLRAEVGRGGSAAAMALRSFGALDEETVSELANALHGDFDLAYEAAVTLVNCGAANHPAVVARLSESERAMVVFARASSFHERRRLTPES